MSEASTSGLAAPRLPAVPELVPRAYDLPAACRLEVVAVRRLRTRHRPALSVSDLSLAEEEQDDASAPGGLNAFIPFGLRAWTVRMVITDGVPLVLAGGRDARSAACGSL